jgi:hypothetical protein
MLFFSEWQVFLAKTYLIVLTADEGAATESQGELFSINRRVFLVEE